MPNPFATGDDFRIEGKKKVDAAVVEARASLPPPPRRPVPATPTSLKSSPNCTLTSFKDLARGEAAEDTLINIDEAVDFPASPPKWDLDEDCGTCSSCNSRFDWKRRKHHCRACGHVFCAKCTSQKFMLPGAWAIRAPQKVCYPCSQKLIPLQPALIQHNANSQRENKIDTRTPKRYLNRPINFTLGGEVRKAARTLHNIMNGVESLVEDHSIIEDLLKHSCAVIFLTVMKISFIGGIRVGTGLVLARLPDNSGWSAPCAIGTIGLSIGAEVGLETTDMVIPLKSAKALRHFTEGRTASAEASLSTHGSSREIGYSHSKGFYGGVAVQGAYCRVRNDVNHAFYGYKVSSQDVLTGRTPRPQAALPLYEALETYRSWVTGAPNGMTET